MATLKYICAIKLLFFLIFTESAFSQIIVAHRGGAGADMQESSIEAFTYSLSQNIKILESDLHLTKDNELVLYHDPYLFKNKKQPLKDLTFQEAVEISKSKNFDLVTLDRLAEFLKAQDESVSLELEIKFRMPSQIPHNFYKSEAETVDVIMAAIDRLGLTKRVMISSFSGNILKRVRARAPSVPLKYLYRGTYVGQKLGNVGPCKQICYWPKWREALKFVQDNNIEVFSPSSFLLLNPTVLKLASVPAVFKKSYPQERSFQLSIWTVNSRQDYAKLKETVAMDDIITDYPGLFKQ